MHRCPYTVVICTVLAVLAPTGARATDPMPDRLWPVPLTPGVASDFCEYREGHLHAGLDVRTYGREGVECLAADDGYVSRVRATPSGYGQAVYVQLYTGETLVYAHLSQFAPSIDSLVTAEQERVRRYSVDFRPAPGRVPVRRGDVIAYSGSTGGVDPHLHFEVRNERERPLNPLEHGFALEDTTPPAIKRVTFVPLAADASIDGACYPLELSTRALGPGRYTIDDTLSIDGAVGLETLTADHLNAESGRLAPRSFEVLVDDTLVTLIEFEAFDFTQAGEVGVVYDVARVWVRGEHVFQLYERPGETLYNRRFIRGGRLLADGPADGALHSVRLTARDAAGNEGRLDLVVRWGAARSPRAGRSGESWSSELDGYYFHDDLMASEPARGGEVLRAADLRGAVVHRPGMGTSGGYLTGMAGGSTGVCDFPSLGLSIGAGTETFHGDVVVYAAPGPAVDSGRTGGLVPRTGPVRIGPYSLSTGADMTIRLAVENPDSDDAIFRMTERSGRWVHYASKIEGDTVTTTARRPGVYAVFADRTAPAIRMPRASTRLVYATGERIPELQVAIDDSGSGVDYDRCVVFLNGVRQIARWDLSARKFFILLRDENIMGPQALTVVAYDNIGHRSELDATIDIPRRTRR